MFHIAFDPDRPMVASSSFTAGEDTIAAGSVFDWRARGMTELAAFALFSSGLLYHPSSTPADTTVQMPGVASAELADKLEQRERKQRTKRS